MAQQELRNRNPKQNGDTKKSASIPVNVREIDAGKFGVLDILRIVGGLFVLNCLLSYFITNDGVFWGYRPWFVRPAAVIRYFKGPVYLTDLELASYDGSDPTKPIYIGLNGTIYDVSTGARMYGPGGSYNFFAGRDATRAFITGCFSEDSVPDVRGAEWTYIPADVPGFDEPATPAQKVYREKELRRAREMVDVTITGWSKMFSGESGKDYFEVGQVKRPQDWLEALPERKLCEQAQKARPKPKAKAKDQGQAYRGA